MIKTTITILLCFFSFKLYADEGMWMPLMLEKYTITQMQAKGFKLTDEDVYAINKASLKDAVVIFGRGCTGEVVSSQGLLLTNHHCGLDVIQSHSSLTHDYLADGFWAKDKSEEIVNPGLTVTFLRQMEDVTNQVLAGICDTLSETERQKIVDINIASIKNKASENTKLKIEIKPYFNGNQYFMHSYEIFEDVRLVGTPPASIGKFGGDTDNWMWPRHTGDFCVFRIYANAQNQPSAYSPDNVPYQPIKHFEISIKGIQEDDFTMVLGFPGNTYQYVPSYHISMLKNDIYPLLIDIRTQKLDIIKRWMATSRDIRIQYTAKEATIANTWKRWIGETRGLEKLNTITTKQQYETTFMHWANSTGNKNDQTLLPDYEKLYAQYTPYRLAESYIAEMLWRNGMELVAFSGNFAKLNELIKTSPDSIAVKNELKEMTQQASEFFKDYHLPLDKEMTAMLLSAYRNHIAGSFHPAMYAFINKHFKGNIDKYVDYLMQESRLTTLSSVNAMLSEKPSRLLKSLESDPIYQLYQNFLSIYANQVYPTMQNFNRELGRLNRQYMAAQMVFNPQKSFYPDANFTMRVAYGNVKGYHAADAVSYLPYSTIDGIIAKENPEIFDYQVPQRLKELYHDKDFGRYGIGETLPVCFIATNHTTGGNSGSPVLDANGRLIGINFDRAWEGVMRDRKSVV